MARGKHAAQAAGKRLAELTEALQAERERRGRVEAESARAVAALREELRDLRVAMERDVEAATEQIRAQCVRAIEDAEASGERSRQELTADLLEFLRRCDMEFPPEAWDDLARILGVNVGLLVTQALDTRTVRRARSLVSRIKTREQADRVRLTGA